MLIVQLVKIDAPCEVKKTQCSYKSCPKNEFSDQSKMWFVIVLSVVLGVVSADLDHSKFISLFSCNLSQLSVNHTFLRSEKHETVSLISWYSMAVII